jgi:ABC-type polysaccharide/polyol phosphate export permease
VLREIWKRRQLLAAFSRRDFATRYRASLLGWAWSLLQPLATLVLFGFVFSYVFKVQAPPMGNGAAGSYPAYLLTGLVTWNLLTGLMNASMTQLLISGELRRKVAFPIWAPVIGGSVVELLQVALEFGLLVVFLLVLGNVGWTWLLGIPILLAAAFFAQGIGLVLAMMNARHGDVLHTTTVVLTLLYFLTPVLYPLSMAESQGGVLEVVIISNPLTWFVSAMHDVMYSLVIPPTGRLFGLFVIGYVSLWCGFRYTTRHEQDIGELV